MTEINEYSEKYYVYFLYDINNSLLYIGLSIDLYNRCLNHLVNKKWAYEINKIGFREYPNEETMKMAEAYYISKLKPKYNVSHNRAQALLINFDDPYREKIMYKKSFISTYNSNKKNSVRKVPLYQKYEIQGYQIIKRDSVDLFDLELSNFNLDKIVFLYNEYFIEFNGDHTNKSISTNTVVKNLKSYFVDGCQIDKKDVNNLFLSISIQKSGMADEYNLIRSIEVKNNVVINIELFTNDGVINFSKDKIIVNFNHL